jgi:antitoxin PrlF
MFATLTSKGQLTLPKEIRDRLGLDAGSVLDFALQPDNTITARAVKPDARRIRGLLKSPHAKALTVEQQREAVGLYLMNKRAPAKRVRSIKPARSAR